MGQPVSGIRDVFFRDLTGDYKLNGEESFLYEAFWQENAAELMEEVFPESPMDGPLRPEFVRERLAASMAARPERARGLLLREPPGKARKERRDFWRELLLKERRDFWRELLLNDAGYAAGLVQNTDYYCWIVEYLAARNVYYKDGGMWGGHECLQRLLRAGLPGRDVRTMADTGRALDELAELVRDGRRRPEIAARLEGLGADYLPWLAGRLERMALHVKIKIWLQDSGYPLTDGDWDGEARPPKGPRKRDFTLRLFASYCDSPEGYDFIRKDLGGSAAAGWRVDGDGFCVLDLDREQIERLQDALERSKAAHVYIPLAVHLFSGSVFFLAGKGVYEDRYQHTDYVRNKKLKELYRNAEGVFCYDYLRLVSGYRKEPRALGKGLRMQPAFHLNAGKSYEAVLDEFKAYCSKGERSLFAAVRAINEELPDGVPDALRWAFDAPEDRRSSRLAAAAFRETRNRASTDAWGFPM